jgi:hypothetical protein
MPKSACMPWKLDDEEFSRPVAIVSPRRRSGVTHIPVCFGEDVDRGPSYLSVRVYSVRDCLSFAVQVPNSGDRELLWSRWWKI